MSDTPTQGMRVIKLFDLWITLWGRFINPLIRCRTIYLSGIYNAGIYMLWRLPNTCPKA